MDYSFASRQVMTQPLSPAAQAVLDAFLFNWPDNPLDQDRLCLAAKPIKKAPSGASEQF
jgi:hypothetical protein